MGFAHYKIGTLVKRNKDYGVWGYRNRNKENFFTEVGEVIDINYSHMVVKVRWPDGNWYRYEDSQALNLTQPTKWSLPDELFEI